MSDVYERYQKLRARSSFNLEAAAFPQQLKFINDQAKLKALFCTRRAAKSYTGGLYLVHTALSYPSCNCLFVGLTRQSAHGIIWKDILRELDHKYKLNIKFNETLLTATFPNGSVIWVTGVDTDEQEMNKLLGKKYKLAVLDEASMFTINTHQLVYGVLKPATADQRGSICLLGTSSNITRGLFYDVTTNREPGWSLHTWTAYDNPHVKTQWEEEIKDIEETRPHFKETALFKQWYLNQWVIDEDAKVYKYTSERNRAFHLPVYDTPYHFVLGIDLGHSPDPSAFVVGTYHDLDHVLYFIHAEHHLNFDITAVADKVKELERKYTFDVKIVDNANKQAVYELNNRHDLNLIPADKLGKSDFINLMNDEFIQRKIILTPQAQDLANDYDALVWMTDNGKVKLPRKEHPNLPNHNADAALYAWRYCYNYLFKLAETKPLWGSQEHWEPKHIKGLEELVRKQMNPNELEVTFDEDLFDFSQDDGLI